LPGACSGLFLSFDLAEGNNSVRTVAVGPQAAAQLDAAGVNSSEKISCHNFEKKYQQEDRIFEIYSEALLTCPS
jgi:hypothetical protein